MKVIPRRLFDEDKPDGYLESDNDYVRNNIEVAVRLLDAEVKRQRGLAAVVPNEQTGHPTMKRAEARRVIGAAIPSAVFSTRDLLGTKLHPSYLDVTVPSSDLDALLVACLNAGLRAVGVSVLPYPKVDGEGNSIQQSHRRICL